MSSNAGEPPPTLTSQQMAEAVALYTLLQKYRGSGTRQVIVHLDDVLGVRTMSQRVNVVVPALPSSVR